MKKFRITADCRAVELDGYGRETTEAVLSKGTVFRIEAEPSPVGGHAPDLKFYVIQAEGKRYRIESHALDSKNVEES
jgi:hypothetical protein